MGRASVWYGWDGQTIKSWKAFDQNSLTSIDQSGEQLGLQATRLLVERIEGRHKAENFLVHPRLVARRSTAGRPVEAKSTL